MAGCPLSHVLKVVKVVTVILAMNKSIGRPQTTQRQSGDIYMGNVGLIASILSQMAENHHFLAVYRGGKKSPHFATHCVMLKLEFYPSQITTQCAKTGLSRTFLLQAEAGGHFSGFVSVFASFFYFKTKSANFGLLDSMLDELNIQNPLPWLSQICLGTCWSSFIGFCDIAFMAGYKGNGPSLKHCACAELKCYKVTRRGCGLSPKQPILLIFNIS